MRRAYLEAVAELCGQYRQACFSAGIDYVLIDTSQPFDRALVQYLSQRKARF
jgi:hypothetical protein